VLNIYFLFYYYLFIYLFSTQENINYTKQTGWLINKNKKRRKMKIRYERWIRKCFQKIDIWKKTD